MSDVAFGRLADQLGRHRKGDMLSASGRLVLTRWTGRDSQERTSWEMVADSLVSARTVRPGGKRKKTTRQATAAPEPGFHDDPIPF